jgi:hypothetical protein
VFETRLSGSFSGANDTSEIGTVPSARDFKKNRSEDLDKTQNKKFQLKKQSKPKNRQASKIEICTML